MSSPATVTRQGLDEIVEQLAKKLSIGASNILPFGDFTDLISAFLSHLESRTGELVVGGHATPDIEIAADRADMRVAEVLGPSPFIGCTEDILSAISSNDNIVYLANPNWVTGSSFTLGDVERVARAIPEGTLILDEKYFDIYGITGLPLLDRNPHVVILRSLTAGLSMRSDASGLLIGDAGLIGGFKAVIGRAGSPSVLLRTIATSVANERVRTQWLTMLHNESLRVAMGLTSLGVQNRLTAADFLLLRVADPGRVGNFLARFGTPVENLDGYPGLRHYMKYRLRAISLNDKLLEAFDRMPVEYYRIADTDKRAIMFHRPDPEEPARSALSGREADKESPVRQAKRIRLGSLYRRPSRSLRR